MAGAELGMGQVWRKGSQEREILVDAVLKARLAP